MSPNGRRLGLSVVGFFLLVNPNLGAEGVVSGKVVDQEGNPVKDAKVRILGMEVGREYELTTDKKGRYFHASINLQDRYRLVAEKDGFQVQYVEGARPAFGNNQERGVIDFVLVPGKRGTLDFELTDEDRERMKKEQEEQERRRKVASEFAGHFNAGVQAFNAKNFEEALISLRRASAVDPENGDVWTNIGGAYFNLKEYDESIKAYEMAVQYKLDKSKLYRQLGNAHSAKGDRDKAKEYWEKAAGLGAQRDPEEAATSYFNLGAQYVNPGQNPEAIEAFRKAVEYNPEYPDAHYQLGLTLVGVNQIKDGLTHLKRYLKLSPSGSNAEVARALVE